MCALVHSSCFVSIKPIYVQYKQSTQKKTFLTQSISRSSSSKKKTTPNTEQLQKFLINQFWGCHPGKNKEICEERYTTKRGKKWPLIENNGCKCCTRNRINRQKQSSWHKKGKFCMTRRPIKQLLPLDANMGNMPGNEPTRNCLRDLNTTKTSSSSWCRYCQNNHWLTVSTVDKGAE